MQNKEFIFDYIVSLIYLGFFAGFAPIAKWSRVAQLKKLCSNINIQVVVG